MEGSILTMLFDKFKKEKENSSLIYTVRFFPKTRVILDFMYFYVCIWITYVTNMGMIKLEQTGAKLSKAKIKLNGGKKTKKMSLDTEWIRQALHRFSVSMEYSSNGSQSCQGFDPPYRSTF